MKNDSFYVINSEKQQASGDKRINVKFTAEQHAAMKDYADREDINLMQAIRRVVKAGIKEVCRDEL